jgi:benzoylformate decarboxylase/acetolactate synthase-1/2/3 large subunit
MKKKPSVNRREFMKRAAVAGAATVAGPAALAQTQTPAGGAASPPSGEPSAENEVLTSGRPGSDFMVDVLKSLGFPTSAPTPGRAFRGLQESIVNYGGNNAPEFLTCCHEESSVAMAHGYAKIEGKPLAILAHGTVGLQHASMAIYNAWCDRVPVYVILGNTLDASMRYPAWSGCTRCRTRRPWCATTSSGTTRRSPCSTSRSRPCAHTRCR